jgi:hypothetical protein
MLGQRRCVAQSTVFSVSVWLVVFALATPAWAAPPAAEIFPLPNPSQPTGKPPKTHGLTIRIDATACVGIGYCPVQVKVTAATPSPPTRRFTASIKRNDFRIPVPMEVSADLELAPGATTTSAVLHIPQFIRSAALQFDFWEEGEHLPDLSGALTLNTSGINTWQYEDENLPPAILCPNKEGLSAPDIESWQRMMTIKRNLQTGIYAPYDLPEATIDYSSWDIVLISLDELAHVIQERPKCWTSMRQWIAAGGNLWVYGVGEPFGRLSELEKQLDWRLIVVPEPDEKPVAGVPGWYGPDERTAETLESIIDQATTPAHHVTDPALAATMEKERPGLRKRLQGLNFVKRRLGLGYVVALDTSNPMTEHKAYWDLLSHEFMGRQQWHDRHGVSFIGDNPGFWSFLIPGVGLAPIGTFEVLITLFVVGIGPVNYFLLRRRHKLSLLMLTVPSGAAVVTGCLLLYAVFADGFAVRCRSRSFTEINQHHGEAACWSRIAYYAGIAPSQGLQFSSDTAVYPIASSPDSGQSGLNSGRQVEEGSPRRFSRGWLPARTVTQLLTVRARSTKAQLKITPAADGGSMQLTNQLGTRIEQLLVVDENGKCNWAEAISPDAEAKLSPLDPAVASDKLTHSLFTHQLEYPPGWSAANFSSGVFGIGWRSRYYSRTYPSNRTVGAFLEQGLAAIQEVDWLPPRTYVAIVERSPEFELGLERVDDETSFHVILGHW